MASPSSKEPSTRVSFASPRNFKTTFKSHAKEALFPDDPFKQFKNKRPFLSALQYFVPIFEWLPKYNFKLLRYDILAGITITSLAIPQGISYAKLGDIPPIIGLYSSFVPPLVYALFGSSKHLAVGTVAAASLLIAATIQQKVSPQDNPTLYLHLIFTSAFITGVYQTLLGCFRLGILVDYLSHSTIIGFMSGTATIISLQQLKGMFGLKKFTSKTDVISVLQALYANRHEMRWQPAALGSIFLVILLLTRFLRKKNPKLFWLSAIAPMFTVVAGGVYAYFTHAERHGIQIVGELKRGINPISIHNLNFSPEYLPATLKAGIISGTLALAEGIAIGRSFGIIKNYKIDGNKEMIAYGLMNIVGSCTSCYLTTGPFSKTAVNFNAGARTPMSNIVMAICMMLTLLFLAPLFSYTPLVALSAIIMVAMFGLIEYEEAYHFFKVDKFDFCICMLAYFGVTFISMDYGLMMSVALSIVRALLYVARPATCKVGNLTESHLYRDVEQYPDAAEIQGMLILQVGSPIYFANCSYLKERIARCMRDYSISKEEIEHVLLDIGGVTSIDIAGLEALQELKNSMAVNGVKLSIINPRREVMEKMLLSKFVDKNGKDMFFLTIEEAVEACRFSLRESRQNKDKAVDEEV